MEQVKAAVEQLSRYLAESDAAAIDYFESATPHLRILLLQPFFERFESLREATGDHEFIRSKLQGALLAILEGYRAGTRRGVGVSAEGLLGHEDGANPLGLSANGGDTARRGFAVEVQALWYSALIIGADLARECAGETDGCGL